MFPKHDHIGFVMVGKTSSSFLSRFSGAFFSSPPLLSSLPNLLFLPLVPPSLNNLATQTQTVPATALNPRVFNLVFSCARFKRSHPGKCHRENSEAVSRSDDLGRRRHLRRLDYDFPSSFSRGEEIRGGTEEQRRACIVLSCSRVAENKEREKKTNAFRCARVCMREYLF